MKWILTLFIFPTSSHSFWEAAKQAAEAEIILDAVGELSESISDEKELSNHLDEVRKASAEVRGSLRDLDYTQSEIDDLLKGETSSIEDIAGTISRTGRRIRRAKNLIKKIGIAAGSADAVTATQTMEMNQTLSDIHAELQHQRMDREIDKEKQRSLALGKKTDEKKKEIFFKKQFALMEKSSKNRSGNFFPFADSAKNDSKKWSFDLFGRWN